MLLQWRSLIPPIRPLLLPDLHYWSVTKSPKYRQRKTQTLERQVSQHSSID